MLRDVIVAAIRTGVAAAVGFVITYLVGLGVEVPDDFEATLTVVVFGLVVAGYNALVGGLERKVHPLFGLLLGVPKTPTYTGTGQHRRPVGDPGRIEVREAVIALVVLVAILVIIALFGHPGGWDW